MTVEITGKGILIIVLIFVSIFFGLSLLYSSDIFVPEKVYTSEIEPLTPIEVKEYLRESNVLIVDCNTCKCTYNDNHILDAVWISNATLLFSVESDLLVYSDSPSQTLSFCNQLKGNVTGRICYLPGGYEEWIGQK